jgi:hypothetical protein
MSMCPRLPSAHTSTPISVLEISYNRLPPQCQRPNVRCPRMAARRAGARIHPFAFRFLPSFESRFSPGFSHTSALTTSKAWAKSRCAHRSRFCWRASLCAGLGPRKLSGYRLRQQNTSFPERLSTIGSRSPVPLALVRKPCMQGSRADC